jgi:hypothetical protein
VARGHPTVLAWPDVSMPAVLWHGQGRGHAPYLCCCMCLQDGSGKISLRMLQSYASKHGGETLTLEDLKG